MSYSVKAGNLPSVQLCSANGLVAFAAWVGSLSEAPMLHQLVVTGRAAGSVLEQLETALRTNPPVSPDVRHTAEGLLAYLAGHEADAEVCIHP